MQLTATVVALEHGSKYTDKRPRVTVRVHEADSMFSEFTLPVDSIAEFMLGSPYEITMEQATRVKA